MLDVKTTSGQYRGILDRGVPNWRGLRYGKVERRFHPAVPATPAQDLDGSAWGPVPWQVPMHMALPGESPLYPDAVESEDCLMANIWSPSTSGAEPVLVWMHPGRRMFGAGNMPSLDPRFYALHHNVVVVTANFRLGPWGWLYLGGHDPAFEGTANLGLRDQVLLLTWIRDNIAQFGGDPDNVTIFGASSGAADVATLLGTPAAQGLFHKAAIYSNAEQPEPLACAEELADRFLTAGRSLASTPEALVGLPNVAIRQIHRWMLRDGPVRYSHSVDGDLVPRPLLESLADPSTARVPLLVGVTAEEAGMFDMFGENALAEKYAGLPDAKPTASREEMLEELTLRLYWEPAKRLLAATHEGPAWARLFDYHPTTSAMAEIPAVAKRPVHASDNAALFFDPTGDMGNETDRMVAAAEQNALVGLARYGDAGWDPYTPDRPVARKVSASSGSEPELTTFL